MKEPKVRLVQKGKQGEMAWGPAGHGEEFGIYLISETSHWRSLAR